MGCGDTIPTQPVSALWLQAHCWGFTDSLLLIPGSRPCASQPNQHCAETIFHSAVNTLKPQLPHIAVGIDERIKYQSFGNFYWSKRKAGGELSKFAFLVECETKNHIRTRSLKQRSILQALACLFSTSLLYLISRYWHTYKVYISVVLTITFWPL